MTAEWGSGPNPNCGGLRQRPDAERPPDTAPHLTWSPRCAPARGSTGRRRCAASRSAPGAFRATGSRRSECSVRPMPAARRGARGSGAAGISAERAPRSRSSPGSMPSGWDSPPRPARSSWPEPESGIAAGQISAGRSERQIRACLIPASACRESAGCGRAPALSPAMRAISHSSRMGRGEGTSGC